MNAIDSNVLVYAFDLDEAVKGPRAIELLETLPVDQTILLWQVACEVGAVLHRIGPRARNIADPGAAMQSLRERFPLAIPSESILDDALRLRVAHQLSYWDALLIASCIDAGVNRLYTEDLQSTPVIEGVELINPFA
jgi:predicted nucleic acid-binding protein